MKNACEQTSKQTHPSNLPSRRSQTTERTHIGRQDNKPTNFFQKTNANQSATPCAHPTTRTRLPRHPFLTLFSLSKPGSPKANTRANPAAWINTTTPVNAQTKDHNRIHPNSYRAISYRWLTTKQKLRRSRNVSIWIESTRCHAAREPTQKIASNIATSPQHLPLRKTKTVREATCLSWCAKPNSTRRDNGLCRQVTWTGARTCRTT